MFAFSSEKNTIHIGVLMHFADSDLSLSCLLLIALKPQHKTKALG